VVDGHGEALAADGNQFGDAVARAVGVAERARDVAHGGARHHRAEGTYLRDVVVAVLALRVRDHLVAAIIGEVHVDIRRFRALGIQEAFEGQFIASGSTFVMPVV
jgi:hypothetical protein